MDNTVVTTNVSATTSQIDEVQKCTTCLATFESKAIKREHMKCDWHNYNLKRRIAGLPSISSSVFQTHIVGIDAADDSVEPAAPSQRVSSKTKVRSTVRLKNQSDSELVEARPGLAKNDLSTSSAELSESELSEDSQAVVVLRCLFCNLPSSTLEHNLAHMSHAHSFFIPDAEYLTDKPSFLGYLDFVVSSLHECLLCGSEKSTKLAVQDHMRGKGHCRVDFESEVHQLWQFYDFGDDSDDDDAESQDSRQDSAETGLLLDNEELRLPSGKILGHRSLRPNPRHSRSNTAAESSSLTLSGDRSPPASRTDTEAALTVSGEVPVATSSVSNQIATRKGTSTSLIGVPESRLRALVLAERGMEKIESRRRNEYQSKVDSGGNKQKRFRVLTMGKKAGGLEKRLG